MSEDNRDDQKPEQSQAEQPTASAGAPNAPSAAETAESFKKAASQILHDRFGIPLTESGDVDVSKLNVQEIQAQAPNLIVGLLDAFTQKLRSSLGSAEGAAGEGGQVIDLEARKAAAAQAPAEGGGVSLLSPELQARLGGKLKDAFNQYVEKNVETRTPDGNIDVNVDLDFIRQHGKPMISSIMRSLAEAILPKGEIDIPAALKKTFTVQTGTTQTGETPSAETPAEGAAPTAEGASAPEADKGGVSVKLNLASILKNLFTPKAPAAAAPQDPQKPSE